MKAESDPFKRTWVPHAGPLLDHDKFGTLYRVRFQGQEPFGIVRVVNSTPEPTGEFKEYFLYVPPNIVSAKQAVAWTFDMDADVYSPTFES